MRRSRHGTCAVLLLGLLCLAGRASASAPPPSDALRAERRLRLVKLWGKVRFQHPWAFSKPAEWDAAFLSALPRVEAATSAEAYAAAVQGMLSALGDDATLVVPEEKRSTPQGPSPTPRPLKSWEEDVLVLDPRGLHGEEGRARLGEALGSLDADLARARAVVLDLRSRGFSRYGLYWVPPELMPHLVEGELSVPGLRDVVHVGLRGQDGSDTPLYYTEFTLPADEVITGTPGKKPALVVFLVDEYSVVTLPMLALRARGKALLVTEGAVDVSSVNQQAVVPLGEGHQALMSMNEPAVPFGADLKLPARARLDGPDKGFSQALALATRPPRATPGPGYRPTVGWRPEPSYPEALYPSRELRLLAGAKLWTVVRGFFPYHHLMDTPWDDRLPELLTKLEAAKDAREYALTLAEAATWLQDGHAAMRGHPELQRFFGVGPPCWVTDIDGRAVVLKLFSPEAIPGLAVGDIIESVDGEPIEARARRFAPYVAGPTSGSLRDYLLRRALSGPEGTTSTLGVRGPQGPKAVKVTYRPPAFPDAAKETAFRVLDGDVGFVDAGVLEAWQVPELFEKLQHTSAIVFDLRGYPRGSMWALGPYFDVKGSRPYALYERPLVGGTRVGTHKALDKVAWSDGPRYRGRVVALIDSRTISQAEHMGLMLESIADTVFVGSVTAGADGDVTYAMLPGGIRFYFTGQDVRHGDGRQLQRKGLEPQVKARPTIAGLQAGRDEVLERALQWLRESSAPRPPRRE